MLLLLDIGNTHTHIGLANDRRVLRHINIPTGGWIGGNTTTRAIEFVGDAKIEGTALSSVVPRVTPIVRNAIRKLWKVRGLELNAKNVPGLGIDYPKPETIGSDRLANAIAAKHYFGAPVVVVDFGTAVTFDVVDRAGNYAGGIIAPGLAAMTDYLHEKTALLPKIRIREVAAILGKNTEQAMLIGAVHGYRGLVRELIAKLKCDLRASKLPVIATGGYARLMASKLPEISAVTPNLTLEGLRLTWLARVQGQR